MNQILATQEKRKSSNPIDTKKIVLFFVVSIIIFGLILLGQGIYGVYKNSKNVKVTPNNEDKNKPNVEEFVTTIQITKTQDNKAVINITSEVEISSIIYNWNSEASQTIDETGKTNIEEIIDIPSGESTLNLSVIDKNGKETKQQETFVIEQSKPVIELSVIGGNIKISVTSKVELSYVTYKWNSEEETKEDMLTYEDKTKFEKTIEIPKGQNTLKIVAVDKNQGSSEKSQDIKGITKAKTSVVAKDGYLHFTVTGEENIKTVEFTFNGKTYTMNTSTFGETKIVNYKMKMVEGMNYLKVISTTQNDAVDTSVWKYEYKA